jgi:hypothetical protein
MATYKLTAVELLGVINDAKSVYGVLKRALDEAAHKGGGGFRFAEREGTLFKINPTFDVNGTRTLLKELRKDIDSLERQLFQYNGQATVGAENSYTVASALREIQKFDTAISQSVRSFTDSVAGMVKDGDDVLEIDLYETWEEYFEALTSKRQLKQRIVDANNIPIEVHFESKIVGRLIEEGVLPH